MSAGYVQVPRRLIEELVQCLESPARERAAAPGSSDIRATSTLEPTPGRVPGLEREIRRLETGDDPAPARDQERDPYYCRPRTD